MTQIVNANENTNKIQIFENTEFGNIRAIEYNNQPYFVVKDICNALEITNSNKAINDLKDNYNQIGVTINDITLSYTIPDSMGRMQDTTLINETGLYDLISQSRKISALKFKHWINSEILPSIRKHGIYATDDWLETALANPENMINMLTKYKEEREKRLLAEQTIEVQRPKVEYFDNLISKNLLTSFRDTAKELKVPERKFIAWLEEEKYIFRQYRINSKGKEVSIIKPYAQYVPSLFEIKDFAVEHKAGVQTLITPKGKETFRLLTEHLRK